MPTEVDPEQLLLWLEADESRTADAAAVQFGLSGARAVRKLKSAGRAAREERAAAARPEGARLAEIMAERPAANVAAVPALPAAVPAEPRSPSSWPSVPAQGLLSPLSASTVAARPSQTRRVVGLAAAALLAALEACLVWAFAPRDSLGDRRLLVLAALLAALLIWWAF